MVRIDVIVWHVGILLMENPKDFSTDNRVHKEAAGITFFLRVGQFGVTYVSHDTAHIVGRRLIDSASFKLCTNIAIINMV